MNSIGARITWAREQRDLKQCWVALKAGLDGARYCRIERDLARRLYVDELVAIAAVLLCTLDWLAYGGTLDPWLPGHAPAH